MRLWLVAALALAASPAGAASLAVCRTVDVGGPPSSPLLIPAGALYRDNGRADDPLAAFTRDRWSLRLEVTEDRVIPPLLACVSAPFRITSDSAVKTVSQSDNRMFVYAGSGLLLDAPASEELMTTQAAVID